MKKKVHLGLLAAFSLLMVTLIGCSTSAGSEDKITVDVFQYKVELKEEIEELAKMYKEENPDVKINVQTLGGGSNYGQSLVTKFSSSEEPDIFNVAGPSEVANYREHLADLSDTKSVETALDGTLNGVTDGEEVLGIPLNQEGYGLIYNKKVLDEAGVNPDSIKTYEDLKAAAETIDKQKDSLGIEAVFAEPGAEKWPMGFHLANSYLAPEFNNDISEAYNSEAVEFERGDELKRMLDLINEYGAQPILSISYSQQVEELFALGKVAMIKQGNWVYNSIYEIDPEFAENNIGIIPLPVEGFEGTIPVGVAMYWGINKTADEEVIQASKDFLDWMNTSETGKQYVMEEFKFIPAFEGYETSMISDPISKEIYEYAASGEVMGWVFNGFPVSWPGGALPVNMQKYLGGKITWEEMIDDSQEKWVELREN
ncbi:ABC transporter substrate-binding protein [Halobacillus karajensis]|uniref:Multiple sugar-binding protein n=1 Tax=Halobacillus karajensis TaxID=195088 RepID=A0A024P0M0_9BACI|nr:ABC transporter substrate-binding protein [Halobacillus karajensis]CDQ19361.1 Multiple sugar-binding protein precursor [Halobacillus karajensis]CDQ21824.1 Multiple sugar-binding protein precursor [Halobacillus karajensis]CDQ27664.1 Multiple sugar-binding protein precursor [Halobacillus karajensis]